MMILKQLLEVLFKSIFIRCFGSPESDKFPCSLEIGKYVSHYKQKCIFSSM